MARAKSRKRPCKICRRWFLPDTRHENRQQTCGPECREELHRRQCADWNRVNQKYFKANYLQKKLERCDAAEPDPPAVKSGSSIPKARIKLHLPRSMIQDATGLKLLVIMEYIVEQIARRHRAVIRAKPASGKAYGAFSHNNSDSGFQDARHL